MRSAEVTDETARFVVVAVPETVSPPPAVPLPMVVDAYAVNPPLNCVSVVVAFPANANGYCERREEVDTF